ncbi:MAG: MBL fold metallo-hydrolase [Candidatus Hodarchaeales archaeon]|jgi:glyoxylase-like metal-dependent hydrolase (beta-lactamase superfamily II)
MKSRLLLARIIAHSYAADVIANEDPVLSAAHWYKTTLQAVDIDIKITNCFSIQLAEGTFQILPTHGHTPGSIVGLLETENHCVLFGQDIHGPFLPEFKSDITQWRQSMNKLIAIEPDYLCEGHFGIIRGKEKVKCFIEEYLDKIS